MFLKEEIAAAEKLFLSIHDHRFDFCYRISGEWRTATASYSSSTKKVYRPRLSDLAISDVLNGNKTSVRSRNKILNDVEFLGVGFGKHTKYFACDIDTKSPYYNLESVEKILEITKHMGKPLFMQSSESGGWHLRWYFSDPVITWGLAVYIRSLFTAAGFEIQGGKLELFPNKKGSPESSYHRLRLPCQKGSALLSLEDSRILASHSEDPELFLYYWAEEVNKSFIAATNILQALSSPFKSEKSKKWFDDYKELKVKGFTNGSQTNWLLGKIAQGMIVFDGIVDVDILTKALCKWIDEKNNGLSDEYNVDPRIAYDHCRRWSIAALKRHKPLQKVMKHKKINHSKKSISALSDHTLDRYITNGQINFNMSIRKISSITGISKSVVQRKLKTLQIQRSVP